MTLARGVGEGRCRGRVETVRWAAAVTSSSRCLPVCPILTGGDGRRGGITTFIQYQLCLSLCYPNEGSNEATVKAWIEGETAHGEECGDDDDVMAA
ncbi:hypothetical protein O3P69_000073 [Scylla paramamosain]|uniref:Uncharacterized protein n=1 Tax=Scylla paramamosain TaxID=85552 RepID=A0AAW0UUD3_SCYPA